MLQCIQVKEVWTQAAYTRSITLSLLQTKESALHFKSGILQRRPNECTDIYMTVYPFKANSRESLEGNSLLEQHI